MDLVMWKQTPFEDKQMGHILKGEDLMTIFDDLEGKNTDDEEKGP